MKRNDFLSRNGKMRNSFFTIAFICLWSCRYDVEQKAMPPLPEVVSFADHILPMFNTHCSQAQCHAGYDAAGHLDLTDASAYTSLYEGDLVDTLSPSSSILYLQMRSVNRPMPPSGRLDDFESALVLKWIDQGGRNN